ncbi:hypothetical protein BJX70DRAFT_393571 [Aspergillus crustosus]
MMEIHNALGLNYEVSDPDYYRKVLIKMYWDGSETPSVLAPISDFFCVGNSMAANIQSLPFTVSVKPSEEKNAPASNSRTRTPRPISSTSTSTTSSTQKPLGADILYFHAHWRRENPANGWAPSTIQTNSLETQIANLDGKDNYTILKTEGTGHYIGCNHSVAHFQGTWWGEGDEMIFLDDDAWPPSMHGTGAEDYFAQG